MVIIELETSFITPKGFFFEGRGRERKNEKRRGGGRPFVEEKDLAAQRTCVQHLKHSHKKKMKAKQRLIKRS